MKIIVLAILVILGLVMLQRRNIFRFQGGKKIALGLLCVAGIITVVWPQWATPVAHFLGLRRSSDLLLILTALTVVSILLGVYIKFRDQAVQIQAIARKVALLEAISANQERLGRTPGVSVGAEQVSESTGPVMPAGHEGDALGPGTDFSDRPTPW